MTDAWIHLAAKMSVGDCEPNVFLDLNRYFVPILNGQCVRNLLERNLPRRYCRIRRTEAGADGFEFTPSSDYRRPLNPNLN